MRKNVSYVGFDKKAIAYSHITGIPSSVS